MAGFLVGGVTAIQVGRGNLGEIVDGTEPLVVVLTQPGAIDTAEAVRALAARRSPTAMRVLPDGEGAKSLAVVEETAGWLGEIGMRRDGILVGVGGGALTDLAGFVGSVFMRGVQVRYVPTTLLGAVDAAIGGKTAVNVGGKNLVGTFSHPQRVVVDVDVLDRLPPGLITDGMAEAIKAGLIGDVFLLALLEESSPDLEEVVRRAIAVKAAIVERDFTESNIRAHLNFGHTVGHAVEVLLGWSHGRSVAVGMVVAAEISARMLGFGDTPRIRSALSAVGLPVACEGVSRPEVHRLVQLDKKADADGLRMVLLEAIGRPQVSHVDTATLDFGLDAIGIGER